MQWLSDGRIVVADVAANRLLLFDSTGILIRSLGRNGEGPGEFRRIRTLRVIPGDSLVTFDDRLRRLSVFHPDTGYVRSIRVGGTADESWPEDAWLWRDGRVVVMQLSITPLDSLPAAAGVRRWPLRARLTLTDASSNVIAMSPGFAGTYTAAHERGDSRVPFANRPFAAVARDRVYFGSGAAYALLYVDSGFTWTGELRWPAQQEKITQSEIDTVRAQAQEILAKRGPPERLAGLLATSFAPQVQPSDRPAIGRVLVDADERLWVERFEPLSLGRVLQEAGDRWTVLSAQGEPLARLRIPMNSRLEAVRGDNVLLVVRDSLDIQSVALHRIVR